MAFFYFREDLLVLEIYHFWFFSLHFSYFKELVYCLLLLSWQKSLFFYCGAKLAQEDILDFPQELMTAWGSCIMVPGNHYLSIRKLTCSGKVITPLNHCEYLMWYGY
jgi:hypothetical protein